MRKILTGMAAIALGMSMTACNKSEPAANEATNEAVAEEPMANETMDANATMDMNASEDMNAATDANAADANAAE
jgi:hypothetical protein